jgi:hypothetical protein
MKPRKVIKNIKNNNSADISLSQKGKDFILPCGLSAEFFYKRGGEV